MDFDRLFERLKCMIKSEKKELHWFILIAMAFRFYLFSFFFFALSKQTLEKKGKEY
jgi:hypothetical protein